MLVHCCPNPENLYVQPFNFKCEAFKIEEAKYNQHETSPPQFLSSKIALQEAKIRIDAARMQLYKLKANILAKARGA